MPPFNPDAYKLPSSSAKVMPEGLGQDFFSSLDEALQLQENRASENIFGMMESRGLLNSGMTNQALLEEVLGPGLQRRQQAYLPFAFQAASRGQEQQFQKDFAHDRFMDQLQYLQEQARIAQQQMFYQFELNNAARPNTQRHNLGEMFTENLATNFGGSLGSGLGKGIAGGIGGVMGGMGGMTGQFGGGMTGALGGT